MTDDGTPRDPDLEEQLRAAFARADVPPAPATLVANARAIPERKTAGVRRGPFASLPFALATVAVLVTVGLVGAALSQGRHSTTQGEELLTPGLTATSSGSLTLLTEAQAIAAARAGMAAEVPGIGDAPVVNARRDRYANAVDTFAYPRSPEPAADHPVWHIDFAPGPDRRGASVVLDAVDGTVLFAATYGG